MHIADPRVLNTACRHRRRPCHLCAHRQRGVGEADGGGCASAVRVLACGQVRVFCNHLCSIPNSSNASTHACASLALLQITQDVPCDQRRQASAAQHRCACSLRREQGSVRVGHEDNDPSGGGEQAKAGQEQDTRCVAVCRQRQRAQRLRLAQQPQGLDPGQREAGLLGCEGRFQLGGCEPYVGRGLFTRPTGPHTRQHRRRQAFVAPGRTQAEEAGLLHLAEQAQRLDTRQKLRCRSLLLRRAQHSLLLLRRRVHLCAEGASS